MLGVAALLAVAAGWTARAPARGRVRSRWPRWGGAGRDGGRRGDRRGAGPAGCRRPGVIARPACSAGSAPPRPRPCCWSSASSSGGRCCGGSVWRSASPRRCSRSRLPEPAAAPLGAGLGRGCWCDRRAGRAAGAAAAGLLPRRRARRRGGPGRTRGPRRGRPRPGSDAGRSGGVRIDPAAADRTRPPRTGGRAAVAPVAGDLALLYRAIGQDVRVEVHGDPWVSVGQRWAGPAAGQPAGQLRAARPRRPGPGAGRGPWPAGAHRGDRRRSRACRPARPPGCSGAGCAGPARPAPGSAWPSAPSWWSATGAASPWSPPRPGAPRWWSCRRPGAARRPRWCPRDRAALRGGGHDRRGVADDRRAGGRRRPPDGGGGRRPLAGRRHRGAGPARARDRGHRGGADGVHRADRRATPRPGAWCCSTSISGPVGTAPSWCRGCAGPAGRC